MPVLPIHNSVAVPDSTIYLRPEDGPAAVKIEASLTLEEMAALLSGCRLFDVEE